MLIFHFWVVQVSIGSVIPIQAQKIILEFFFIYLMSNLYINLTHTSEQNNIYFL
jgi:hypothetical protein